MGSQCRLTYQDTSTRAGRLSWDRSTAKSVQEQAKLFESFVNSRIADPVQKITCRACGIVVVVVIIAVCVRRGDVSEPP